jgi:hypothetical protein
MRQSNPTLQEFPGPLTLYPSTRKWVLLLLGCIPFDAAGLWMVAQADPWGWYGLIVCASGTIVAVVMLLPGSASLKLDQDGIQITNFFRVRRTRWEDVSRFMPFSPLSLINTIVIYDDVSAAPGIFRTLNAAIARRNAWLPDTYGLSADNLAAVMAQWRERALASQPGA